MAFLLKLKAENVNSTIDLSLPTYKIAARLNISPQAFKKQFTRAKEYGLIRNKSYYCVAINWRAALSQLGLIERNRNFKKLIDRKKLKEMNLRQISVWVHDCVLNYNLLQQQYQINKKKPLVSLSKKILANSVTKAKGVKKLIKLAEKEGVTTQKYCGNLVRSFRKNIVTGSQHLSRKIGLSQASNNRALNRLVAEKIIERKVEVKYYQYPLNNATFDLMIDKYGRDNFIVSTKHNSYIKYKGSKINLL